MEKEITNVLSLMKTSQSSSKKYSKREIGKLTKVEEYEQEVNQISDELFKRLDKILESSGASSRSCRNSLIKKSKRITFGKQIWQIRWSKAGELYRTSNSSLSDTCTKICTSK